MADVKHLWWLFRNMIKQACLGDFKQSCEAFYWIRIHLTYKSKRIDERKSPK